MADPSPDRGVMIVLAYLWPLALVPLLIEKHDAEVQWHAKHGIVLMAAYRRHPERCEWRTPYRPRHQRVREPILVGAAREPPLREAARESPLRRPHSDVFMA